MFFDNLLSGNARIDYSAYKSTLSQIINDLEKKKSSPNQLWIEYHRIIHIVSILICAERTASWNLHVHNYNSRSSYLSEVTIRIHTKYHMFKLS